MLNDGFSEKIASPVEDTPRTSFQSRSTFRTPVAIIFLFLNNRIPTAMPLNLQDKFPRVSLGFFPSPIQPLKRLSAELGISVWAKRDDVSSGLAFGGTKVRKLEIGRAHV